MGAFDPPRNLCQKRKEKGSLKSFSGSFLPEEQPVAKVLNEKEYQPAHLSFLILPVDGNFGNRQIKGLAISRSALSFVLEVELHSGRFIPSLCLILMHFL